MVRVQKRKIQWAISLFLVMLYFSGLSAQAQYGGGTGEPNDPYLIYTAEQMNEIGAEPNDWDKHFKFMEDIDLSSFTGADFNDKWDKFSFLLVPWNGDFVNICVGKIYQKIHRKCNLFYLSFRMCYSGTSGTWYATSNFLRRKVR